MIRGNFCYFCKDYFFSSTDYLVQYKSIPGLMMDGQFCDYPEWICCCNLCKSKMLLVFDVLQEKEFSDIN